ncbi:uncharacterized protein LOC128260254 isoform X1 [Drosophila gunungcola]|uniref:uncharacterized protein LOC128260254 isoform X1 n=1 Tax=Drosophila gunungcola TaxID=103775 RepID=UPI0022E2A263|nr:uncharacterized protein LOC128260254 isoform X1 [Drosophila gunungcola]
MDQESPEEAAYHSEARREILDIARNRTGTQAAKCILAYDEQEDLDSLIVLLEELSKNTDYSTDLRISLGYYIKELQRHCLQNRNVSGRLAIMGAGSALQFFGKIYGDRVEYLHQVVEHQMEALRTVELQKQKQTEQTGGSSGPDNNVPTPEEPRKRRAKKLTQKEVDPYMLTVEPRKFKTMSPEKRFNLTSFVKCTRNQTIEYLYQDHTPPNLWRHAPIVDPHNPNDQDEKKQYKMFTYYVEHRYNTLLPDIPFERLNLIKEYVHTNQVNTAEILNEHLTTKDYLDEYIALENQMLAARYGATVRTRRTDETAKRTREETAESELPKKVRLDENEPMDTEEAAPAESMDVDQVTIAEIDQSLASGEALQNQISVDSGLGDSINTSQQDSTINATLDVSQLENSTLGASQVENFALSESQVQDSSLSISQVENSLSVSQVENPPLSSTLAINESSVLDSTRLDLPPAKDDSIQEISQFDSGIGMDDVFDSQLHTGQSFDDEGVVLSDQEDQRQLSRKLDLPGNDAEVINLPVENTDRVTKIDAEVEMDVPREVCYPITLNILRLPQKNLRRKCIFKLPKVFDLFKQSRLPSKRETAPKPSPSTKALPVRIEKEVPQTEEQIPGSPVSLEFDEDFNFLGFRQRRPTLDSGFDFDELRAESGAVSTIGEVNVEIEDPVENQANKVSNESADNVAEATVNARVESGLGESIASDLNTTTEATVVNYSADAERLDETENSGAESGLGVTANAGMESGLEATISSELDTTTEPIATDSVVLDVTQLDHSTMEVTTMLDNATIIDEAPSRDLPANTKASDDRVQDAHVDNFAVFMRSDSPLDFGHPDSLYSSLKTRDWQVAHERQNFNINDLSTEILNVCTAGNGTATLADVMKNKDPSIMCCYMLASLMLANNGNVTLSFGVSDNSKPNETSQFCMQLKSTEGMEIHPEDDVGNMNASKSPTAPVKTKRKSTETASPEVFAKTVRLIQPIPKISQSSADDDSGISSMGSSLASTSRSN